jgi:hypothetical protein
MIDIKGMAMARITPPNPPAQQYPIIEIAFIKTPIVSSIVSYDCAPPPGIIGRSIGVFPPPPIFMNSPALPQYIKFIAMDEEQTILQIGNEGDDIFLKASVKKLKD